MEGGVLWTFQRAGNTDCSSGWRGMLRSRVREEEGEERDGNRGGEEAEFSFFSYKKEICFIIIF